jgi:hypothetical protein
VYIHTSQWCVIRASPYIVEFHTNVGTFVSIHKTENEADLIQKYVRGLNIANFLHLNGRFIQKTRYRTRSNHG